MTHIHYTCETVVDSDNVAHANVYRHFDDHDVRPWCGVCAHPVESFSYEVRVRDGSTYVLRCHGHMVRILTSPGMSSLAIGLALGCAFPAESWK